MPKIVIKLAPPELMFSAFYNNFENVKKNLDRYVATKPYETNILVGDDAAEDAFDLTNNPSRQKERELKYGRGRSLSAGDIVDVVYADRTETYLCLSLSWKRLQ